MKIDVVPPRWWDEPSENRYCRGMSKGEEIMDFLDRHAVTEKQGKYLFFHTTTPQNFQAIMADGFLRKGSYLAFSEKASKNLVRLTHAEVKKAVTTFRLWLAPWEIEIGVHPQLRIDKAVP